MRSEATTQRHIKVLRAIANGLHVRTEICARLKLTDTEARISFARLQKLGAIEAEEIVSSDGSRRRYELAMPLERAIESISPPRQRVWSDALSAVWRAPVAIPEGTVAHVHVVGW